MLLLLPFLLAACEGTNGGTNYPGQTYPDAPQPFVADDTGTAISNYGQTLDKPLVFGLGLGNKGSTPIVLDSIKLVDAPSNATLVETGISRPEENDNTLLPVGYVGYPPMFGYPPRPYTLHPLHNAIVNPQEYLEVLVALKSPKVGAFLAKGFLLTLEMNGKTYQHYYRLTAVLCVEVDHATCDKAFARATQSTHH